MYGGMSDAEIGVHNDRVAASWRAEREYKSTLTPEQMIQQMQDNPSHKKFRIFSEVFSEIMEAQMTRYGADAVASDWAKMREAYNQFTGEA